MNLSQTSGTQDIRVVEGYRVCTVERVTEPWTWKTRQQTLVSIWFSLVVRKEPGPGFKGTRELSGSPRQDVRLVPYLIESPD